MLWRKAFLQIMQRLSAGGEHFTWLSDRFSFMICFPQCTWSSEPTKRQRKTQYASLEERIDILNEKVVSLESRLARYPDVTTETPHFCPHSESEVPVSRCDGTQHEVSFQGYTQQVEGMLGKYMMKSVQHLVKQKWGEVRNGASALPLSIIEAPRDTKAGTTGTSGPSSSAMVPNEDDHHLSLYAQGMPDFYSLFNPDDGVKLGRQQSAINQTTSAPKGNNVTGNWGSMSGSSGFASTISGDLLSTATGRVPLVNEGPQDTQQGDSQTLWPKISHILSEDMEMYPQF
jgi:hypothetical protein